MKYIIFFVIMLFMINISLAAVNNKKTAEVAKIDQENQDIATRTATFALG